jgi:hypothetical protein
MHVTRRATSAMAAMAIGAGLTVLGAGGPAMAAQATLPALHAAPQGCAPNQSYSFSAKHSFWVTNPNPGLHVSGPGGVQLHLSVTHGTKVHGEVSGSGDFSIPKLVNDAKLKIDANLAYTKSMSVTQSATWRVPQRYGHGWLAFGYYGYSFKWEFARVDAGCKVHVLGRGTGRLPGKNPGFNKGRGIAPPETK